MVDSWKESCPATAEAAVDDDGGDGWRLAAGGDGGHGRGVGWGRVKIKSTVVVGAGRAALREIPYNMENKQTYR